MTQQVIPLSAVPNQTVTVNLGTQTLQLNVYQKRTGLYCDVYENGTPLVIGVICQNANPIIRDTYLGVIGDIAFFDLVGSNDPTYDQIGSRFFLAYID